MSQAVPRAPRRLNQTIRAKWQHHLAAHQTSGLTQAAYCREQGIDAKYFTLWKSKLRSRLAPTMSTGANKDSDAVPTFIAIKVTPDPVAASPVSSLPPIVENTTNHDAVMVKAMLRNGVAIELHVAVASLTCVLSQLSQLPC